MYGRYRTLRREGNLVGGREKVGGGHKEMEERGGRGIGKKRKGGRYKLIKVFNKNLLIMLTIIWK